MREIVHLQIGNSGNAIGSEFWKSLFNDHGIDRTTGQYIDSFDNQLERIDTYFNEILGGRYTPRAIFADLQQEVIDKYRTNEYFAHLESDNFLSENIVSRGNYAQKWEHDEFKDHVMDIVRKEAENSESLQGFQIFHAASGTAGSGLTSLLLENIKDEYSDRIIKTSSIIPYNEAMNLLTEPYDTIFLLKDLISNADVTSVFDIEDIYNLCLKKMKIYKPTWGDINNIVVQVLSGESLSFRFPTDLCSDLRKFASNLVPYQNLHFLSNTMWPLVAQGACFCYCSIQSTEMLTQNLFNREYHPHDPYPNSRFGPILSAVFTYLGKVDPAEAEIEFLKAKAENKSCYSEQIPDNLKYWICNAYTYMTRSGYFTYNSALIANTFKKAVDRFDDLYTRKAFIYKYQAEGMDESEFEEAKEDAVQLISEYQQLINNSNSNEYFCAFIKCVV
ncbi:unnamed protein product [Blepharisma stoltei]|uniref:Tubulin beta chain n=1 Tax=Blepharisma stoltei TaxID=1481888 RepID=A0AAU9K9N4_9CILI|nr:unnamed protein product [Blepharisma stoltei]